MGFSVGKKQKTATRKELGNPHTKESCSVCGRSYDWPMEEYSGENFQRRDPSFSACQGWEKIAFDCESLCGACFSAIKKSILDCVASLKPKKKVARPGVSDD